MSFSCSCPSVDDADPGDHIWWEPEGYDTLKLFRRTRCCSCKELIDLRAIVARVHRHKIPDSDIEVAIHGEDGEVPLADKYLCEQCADIYFSLKELGFCVSPIKDQHELLSEYHDLVKWEKEENEE